ncbi:MAG: response regulator [Eubacterium sp.]|nr:response regulator [Eubacterium sp.]
MSLMDRIEKVRNRGDIELTGFYEKEEEIERDLELYTRNDKFYVLIADADPSERIELERIVDQTGCFVLSVGSGIECLEQITSDKFDLIFIGRNMPRMDGIQTLRNMRNSPVSKCNDAKVFILLDEKVDEPDIFFENAGFDGIVRKPIDKTIIHNIILDSVPTRMIPEDEELIDYIRQNAANANLLKTCDVRYIEGLKNFKGNVDDYKGCVSDFCDSYETSSSDMLDDLYSGNAAKYMEKARAMRDTARKIGAIYLSDCFDDHVNMAKDDSLDVAESNWQALVTEWETVIGGLAAWVGKNDIQLGLTEVLTAKTNGIKLAEKDINDRVHDIMKLLEENKKDDAKKMLVQLGDYDLDSEIRLKIDRAVKAFEKDKVNTVVDILKSFFI